ncbi:unnamed protein product, partial [Mesorhabditis spiculigera]
MMAAGETGFNPLEWRQFYYPEMSRNKATAILKDLPIGTFLLRDSSREGEYSLSVKESEEQPPVKHYLIERKGEDGSDSVTLATQSFVDLAQLLSYYTRRTLDQSALKIPYMAKGTEIVKVVYRYQAQDLTAEPGDHLEVLEKMGDGTLKVRNSTQKTGLIPPDYVMRISGSSTGSKSTEDSQFHGSSNSVEVEGEPEVVEDLRLPATGKVIFDRVPSVYDSAAIRLKKGQSVEAHRKIGQGFYEGTVDGRPGTIPQIYVKWN